MQQIQSEQLTVLIDKKGAELKSVFHHGTNLEYMWSGDPNFWGKTSPVLFPIVGTLKENKFKYNNQQYTLGRHGFAREKEFEVEKQSGNSILFSLDSDSDTLKAYPFPFNFSISYTVIENNLTVEYIIKNEGTETMFFSVGGHPAFKLPLTEGTTYDDYKLIFAQNETAGRWPISKEGLIEKTPQPLLSESYELPLTKQLFQKDAIVFKHLKSTQVKLASDKTPHGLSFDFTGFPYLGLWAAPKADFICIEPWCGIADSVDSDQELKNKEGILPLPANKEFSVSWKATFF